MDTFRSATKEGGMWGAAAAIGGLIYGVYKLGFWKSLGAFLGIGVLSGGMSGRLDDIPDRLEKAANRL